MTIHRTLLSAWGMHRRSILAIVIASLLLAGTLIWLSLLRQGTPFFYQVY